MLVAVGGKLASPLQLLHYAGVGLDQLFFFATTLVVSLAADLLVGVDAAISYKWP